MNKWFLLGSLIAGVCFFSMQTSATPLKCEITLRTDSFHSSAGADKVIKLGQYVNISEALQAGDIIEDIKVPLNWTHINPQNVVIQADHIDYGPGGAGAIVNSGNELWAEDAAMNWERFAPGVKTEIIKKGIISFSGVGPISKGLAVQVNEFGSVYYRFNRLNKTLVGVPPSWCQETARHYVKLFVPADTFGLPYMIQVRFKRPGVDHDLEAMLIDMEDIGHVPPVRVPYDIVRKIGINVPPVVDFGRVDTGVVVKKDINVNLEYVGIPGKGLLTFSYADAQRMEVTVKEKSESQDTLLPYQKYIDKLPPDKMSLSYQIGVKSNTTGDKEQRVLVTFHVF
ncbi:hypothetical protein DEV53_20880 [Salmonella enterica]|nr:hypothetical protein [Salmonella enterica]